MKKFIQTFDYKRVQRQLTKALRYKKPKRCFMSKGGWVKAEDIVQLRRFKEVGVLEVTLMRIIKDDPARFQHVEDKYGE